VIVENFFGRLRTKFAILIKRWPLDDASDSIIFELCCALVNFDIRPEGNPLRRSEGELYLRSITLAAGEARLKETLKRRRLNRLRSKKRREIIYKYDGSDSDDSENEEAGQILEEEADEDHERQRGRAPN
jgi:hypothetical protein